MCDGKTGRPRTIIDIEKAAKLRVVEESVKGLKFRKVMGLGRAAAPKSQLHRRPGTFWDSLAQEWRVPGLTSRDDCSGS